MIEEGLPRAVAVAWGVAEFPQRGPKRELSHEGIVDAAIEIADAEGLDAVTMQRVAASFGFTTMALYRYISTKDELHRLMYDAALQTDVLRALPDQDWRAGLLAWADTLVACYRAHPWLLKLDLDEDLLIMPNNMAVVDAGLRVMRTLPLAAEERLGIIVAGAVLVRGFMTAQGDLSGHGSGHSAATIAAIQEIATSARFPDLGPLVASGSYLGEPAQGSGDEGLGAELAFALDIFLDGIAVRAEGGQTAPIAEPAPPASPREAYDLAERAWRDGIAVRKATEQRVKELYAREAELEKAKDDAKELSRAAERYERRRKG